MRKAVIISGLIFAFWHGIDKGIIFALCGAVFYNAYIYYKTKSLYAPILMHFFNNLKCFLEDMRNYVYHMRAPSSYTEDPSKNAMFISLVMLAVCYPFVIRLFRGMWREVDDKKESVYMYNTREI